MSPTTRFLVLRLVGQHSGCSLLVIFRQEDVLERGRNAYRVKHDPSLPLCMLSLFLFHHKHVPFELFSMALQRVKTWNGCNNLNLIWIVHDKEVSWIMLVMSKFPDNDLLVVVEISPYLSSELPRTEGSRNENGIIDLDAFEPSHTGIRVGSMFRNKSVLKKAIYMLALNNSFELVTVMSNRTLFDIRCKDLSCPWYLRASAPCRPSDVINYMKIHHGVNISYDKALRGRTYTAKEVDDEVIPVDGAAMKNNACTIYGNSQIVPLAFVVVDLENDLS
uniref:Transposase MuDR plant domain-containing protein n=1 Tax=Cucumis melo TaxID=3656 RepID=A0A9I9EDL3_CUCME